MSDYQSLLNNLPSDWETMSIAELGTVVSGGTPSRSVTSFWQGDIPWLTPGEVSKHKSKYMQSTSEYITDAGLNNSGANLIPEGSLLVTSRATLGARVINQLQMTTNQGFKSIVFKDPKDAEYYFHFFSLLKAELERLASGTTFLEISGAEFSEIDLPIPPPKERDKINEVLDTLDTQIRETEVIITKLQQVKQGLSHDLLTRGVDENGELRPSYEEAPELYQPSELGWIPKEWNVHNFNKLLSEMRQGWSPDCKVENASLDEWGVLKTTAISWLGYDDQEHKALPSSLKPKADLEVMQGDVLITRAGPASRVGVVSYVENTRPNLMISDKMYRLRFNSHQVPKFYALALSSSAIQRCIGRTLSGMAESQTNISQKIIRDLPMIEPSEDEQNIIVAKYDSIDSKLKHELKLLNKLILKKSGLMDDLLTGKVRVTELLKQKQAS